MRTFGLSTAKLLVWGGEMDSKRIEMHCELHACKNAAMRLVRLEVFGIEDGALLDVMGLFHGSRLDCLDSTRGSFRELL